MTTVYCSARFLDNLLYWAISDQDDVIYIDQDITELYPDDPDYYSEVINIINNYCIKNNYNLKSIKILNYDSFIY